MLNLPVDVVSVPRNRGREELTSAPRVLLEQAVRYRYLAAKARREASAVSGDPIAPRMIELAEKLDSDATRVEEDARILLAEQGKETPIPQLDAGAGAPGRSCEGPLQATGGHESLKSNAIAKPPALGTHAQGN